MTKKERDYVKAILNKWGESRDLLAIVRKENEYLRQLKCSLDERGRLISSDKVSKLCKKPVKDTSKMIDDILTLKSIVDPIINELDFCDIEIIKARHKQKLTWPVVPQALPFIISKRQCQRRYNKVLEYIYDRLNSTKIPAGLLGA